MRILKIALILEILLLLFPQYTMASSEIYCDQIKGENDFANFHIAACKGDVEAVKTIIKRPININQSFFLSVPDENGSNRFEFNALHTALQKYRDSSTNKNNYKKIIQILVENGINAEYPYRCWYNPNNKTYAHFEEIRPINMAANNEIAELLRKGGAKISPLIVSYSDKESPFKFYKGTIIVSGTIRLDPYDEWFPGDLQMWVDKETGYLIPRVDDYRTAWFCFDNDGTLFTKMKIDKEKIQTKCFSGYAKVQITNYRQYRGESEDADHATLVKVIEMKNYSYKECPRKY